MRRHIFLVEMNVPDNITPEVVRNYISRALKRYPDFDPQDAFMARERYKDALYPGAIVTEIHTALGKDESLIQTVKLINDIKDAYDKFFDEPILRP